MIIVMMMRMLLLNNENIVMMWCDDQDENDNISNFKVGFDEPGRVNDDIGDYCDGDNDNIVMVTMIMMRITRMITFRTSRLGAKSLAGWEGRVGCGLKSNISVFGSWSWPSKQKRGPLCFFVFCEGQLQLNPPNAWFSGHFLVHLVYNPTQKSQYL